MPIDGIESVKPIEVEAVEPIEVSGPEADSLEARATSTLTSTQINSYKPYTYYAGAAYCKPATTLAWNCGSERTSILVLLCHYIDSHSQL